MCWSKVALSFLQLAIDKAGSVSKLETETGIARQTIAKWLSGEASPSIQKYGVIMDYVGATCVRIGDEATRLVSFANITFDGVDVPSQEEYIAVPVLKDPNLIDPSSLFVPKENIFTHSLPVASYQAIRSRPHLIGMFVRDDSMAPLMDPGDVIYVDRADTAVHEWGRLYLVRDAKSGDTCIRRVDIDEEDGDTVVHLTADNPKVRSRHYSLKKFYGGNRRNCILGRVVYGRIDMLNL